MVFKVTNAGAHVLRQMTKSELCVLFELLGILKDGDIAANIRQSELAKNLGVHLNSVSRVCRCFAKNNILTQMGCGRIYVNPRFAYVGKWSDSVRNLKIYDEARAHSCLMGTKPGKSTSSVAADDQQQLRKFTFIEEEL